MNKVILTGRLTKDPETRKTGNGISVTSFTLAVDRKYKNANGEKETDFLNIIAWRQLGELCAKYLYKGCEAYVIGNIQTRSYEAKDGSKRYITEIIADEVEFGRKPSRNEDARSTSAQKEIDPDEEFGEKFEDFEAVDNISLPF